MDEKLIDELFNRAVSFGYKKSREEFISLLGNDDEVYTDMMSYARSKGIANTPTEFDTLIGRSDKKKVQSLVLSEELKKQKPVQVSQSPAMASSLQGGSLESQGYPKPLIPQQRPVADVTYRKAPIETTEKFGQVAREEARKEEAVPEFAKPLIETVTPELTAKREEDVVPQLNYQFGSLGFKFKEAGIGDYVEATAPNGRTIRVSVDEMDVNESTKLRNFIRNNTISIPEARLKEIEKQYSAENKKFTSDKEVEGSIAQLSTQANQLNKDIQDYYISTKLLEEQAKKLASISEEDPNREVLVQQYIAERDRLQKQVESISKRQGNINNNKSQLDTAVGKYTAMKADQGTWYGEVINAPLRGIGNIISGGYGQMVDILEEAVQPLRELTGDKATMDAYIKYAKEEGVSTPKADENGNISRTAFREWLSSIGDKASEYKGRFVDERKKEEKYKIVDGKPLADVLRGLVVEGIGMENTEEYAKEAREGIIPRAILGGLESIPSFAFGNSASRAARMFLQTDDAIMNEMQKDPDFKDISEREKRMISTPIALAGAALEEIGFRNIIANKGLLNKMTMSALGKAGATTTAKTFGDLVKNEVESGLARGTLTIVGGALAEAETGAAQQAAEFVIKDVYNLIKDKRNENGEYMKMFDTPDSFGEYAKEVAVAGLEEAIGGFVLGMPSAISAAARSKGFEGMDDNTFKLFEAASKDENIEKAYVTRLKNQINSGDITIEQAKDDLNEYRSARGLFQSVPENLDLQGKKKAMNLLRERRDLESSIEGKDESLTKPQRDRIKTINEELTKISEDAVQKQTADEGVLRSQRPQLGLQEMGEGDKGIEVTTAGTQAQVAAQLTQEEVNRKQQLEQALAAPNEDKKTITIGESILNIEDAQKELDTLTEKEVSLKRPEAPVAKAQLVTAKFPEVTTTLATEGTGVGVAGEEPVIKGSNADTVYTKTGGFKPDYSTQEILEEEQAPSSRVVSVASNLGTGAVAYTKGGEKVSFSLPFVNQKVTNKIEKLRAKYKAVAGTSKEAKAEKAKISAEINKTAKQQLIEFQNMMTQNLLALYDSLTDSFIAESKQWYVGANRMAQSIAKKYNLTLDQVGGIIAVLSPQNDWFNNVSVAERSIEIMSKYADTKLTKDIVDKAVAYNTDNKGEPNNYAKDLTDLFNQYGEVSINELQSQGLSIDTQAAMLRAFDQALHSPKVAMTNPNGKFTGFDTTPVRWNSNSEIGKAISIFRNTSIENINSELGGGNKVRNFYNNIVDPDSETPYLTADTHALSAALNSPISANDAGGIGLFNGGAEPLYALVKNAYIDAARIAGIKPREMQSITWEAQRIGINDKNRTPEQKQKTFDYIKETRTNNQTPYERATELIARNRSANPSWGKSRGIETQKSSDAIREGARLRAEQRASQISALRGPAGERVGAAPTTVGGAVTGRQAPAEGVKARIEYGTPVANEQGINDIEAAVAQDVRKKLVIDAVRVVTKLFKSLFPNGEIYVFDNQEDYSRQTKVLTKGEDSVGLFSYSKNPDGSLNVRIDIDLTRANATTVYHEIAHAVMLKTFGDNKAKFRQFRDQLTTVLKGSTVKKLDSFAKLYAENEQPEEWLVELAAVMADQDKSIKIDTITKIAVIVNKFVSDLTNGLVKPFSETASKKEVIDFFNQMAVSIKTGQEITTAEQAAPITAATKQARRIETGPEGLPGYDKLIDDIVNTVIPNAITRRLSGQELIDLVNRFVTRSEVYKNADDIQKDAIVRAVNGLIGESYKEPPSINRILGRLKDITKVTITEKQALNNQIKLLTRGAKDATKAWRQANKELSDAINDLANKGRITAKQVAAVISRFAKVNMFDDASISRFVDYMSKVFANAEYAEQIATINKALPNSKKNIETKLGVSKNLIPVLRKLFAIKPTLIPDNLLSDYTALVSMMGERKSVLNLQESGEIMDTASKILSAVQEEQSLAYELADIYEQYPSKVVDEDGNVDYAETIKDMLSNNIITSADMEVMKKYKSIISPSIPAEPMTEQELADEKKALIKAIQDADVDATTLPSRDERDTANKLKRLLRSTDSLNALTNNELKNLLRVIDNINNGFLPNYAQLMIEKMDGAIPSDRIVKSIKKAKLLPLSKIYAKLKSLLIKGKKDAITLMFERNPTYYYDQLLGDFNTRAVYDAIFKPIADAYAAFKSSIISTQERLDKAFKAVEKSFKNNGDDVVMSKYKMTAYLLQLEYLSNPESNKVNTAIEFLDATIKKIRKGKTSYSERDAEMLQDIITKYSADGQIDADKIYNSFNEAEKKAIKTIQDINAEMTSKAEYIAGVLRGEKFTPINNYIHHDVMIESSPTEAMADADAISNFNSRMNPSTRAKSLMERTPGAKAIEFDILKSVNQAVSSQLMDYYLTAPIRTVRKTMNQVEKKLEEDRGVTSEQYKIFNAFNQALERAVETTLITSFKEGTLAEEIVDEISKQGYRAVLASVPRFISELTSNVSAVLTAYSNQFGEGIKYFDVFSSPDGVDIMKNVKSAATTRVYPAGSLSGQMVDPSILNQTSGIRGSRAKGYLASKLQQIYNNTLKKQKNFVELTADALISTPDKIVMRPTWFGAFALAFEDMTGVSPDMKKIAANDEQYMNENIAAIEFARDKADDASVKIGATDNPFMGILKGTATRNQSAWARAFNNFNNFMSRFLINEYVTARTGIYAAMGRGMISRAEGVKLLAAITLRMTIYSVLAPMLSNTLTKMVWGDDDEEPEDEKSLLQKMGQGLASSFTSLAFGRDFGNATKNIVNYGVEKVNAEYLDFLRNGEYDPYKDAIQYSMIPVDPKTAANTSAMDLVAKMGGSMGPALRTGTLLVEKGILKKGMPKEEKEPETLKELIKQRLGIKGKKEKFEDTRGKEIGVRIPFEVLGNLGYIPLYKDARNVMLKELYKDLEKGKKALGNKKELEKLLLQGYESKTDMRRYDPDMYEVTFGEDGVFNLLNIEGYKDKIIDDVIDDIVRDIKDDIYQYTPKNKSNKFGGGAFGGEKKKSEFGGGKFGE